MGSRRVMISPPLGIAFAIRFVEPIVPIEMSDSYRHGGLVRPFQPTLLADSIKCSLHTPLVTFIFNPPPDLLTDFRIFVVENDIRSAGFDELVVMRRCG